jgi:hypothetical protein
MTADTTIATHHTALLELLAMLDAAPSMPPDGTLIALLDAAMAQLALEGAALRALAEHGHVDLREHQAAHGRARLALFRVATSPSDSLAVERAVEDLRDAFGDRPRVLAGELAKRLDARALDLLAEEMKELR